MTDTETKVFLSNYGDEPNPHWEYPPPSQEHMVYEYDGCITDIEYGEEDPDTGDFEILGMYADVVLVGSPDLTFGLANPEWYEMREMYLEDAQIPIEEYGNCREGTYFRLRTFYFTNDLEFITFKQTWS
jgi:hypothetical protein